MKKIVAFFTNRIVISVIGLIALSIIVWFVGPMIKFGENNTAPLASEIARLVVIMVLLLLWGLNNLRLQMKDKKGNAELIGDIEQNQDLMDGPDPSGEQSSEEYHLLSQRFSDALATLSKLRFKGKNKALYQLPWYIIIGPPGSGKTTALVNSSLEFPLAEQFGKAALQGVGGTRNCDWWFTNEAVLIDTAGRYTTHDSHKVVDSSAWEAFLSLLKKNRRRRPINGAIVAISIQDLLTMTEQELVNHAKVIRTRIDELMQKLEIRFPVYLVFTKADLISGFSEFFEDLSREDREQVWGVSLPNAPAPSQSPDFEFFDREFDRLISRLYERDLARMHYERDVKRRGLIQGFPVQVENLKVIIDRFVKQAFTKNRYDNQPYLRGIYFTSGTQDGTPIDRLMTTVAANFGFAPEQGRALSNQGKSFFLGDLFRKVVFPESELVGANRKFEAFLKWSRRAAYVSLVVLSVGLIATWYSSLQQHDEFMLQVDGFSRDFEKEEPRLKGWNKDIRVIVPALNALANASIVYDQEKHPWISGLGMYDANVDRSADKAYRQQLKTILMPRVIQYLEQRVAQGHQGGDLYHNFRIYMMFNRLEHMDTALVREWFHNDWKENMQGEASFRQALDQHLGMLLSLDFEPQELNQRLVGQTRSILLRVPVHQRIYSRIRTQPEYRQRVDLLNLLGEPVRATFHMDDTVLANLNIPFMFTKEGYDRLDLSTESPMIADIVRERWVLSDDDGAKVDFIQDDLEEISEKVKQLYLTEYVSHWEKVLKSLKIAEFKSLSQAQEVLALFVDPVDSPLHALLQVIRENTKLSVQVAQDLNDDHGEGKAGKVTAALADQFKGTPVDQRFRAINVLTRESSKKPAPVKSIDTRLLQVKEFITDLSIAPDVGKKSFQIALARFQAGSGNPLTNLSSFAADKPEPVRQWLETLSDQSWKIIIGGARGHINQEWKAQVYSFYQEALAGRYPLRQKSSNEMALLDFSDFFKPQGRMDKFYLKYIKPFINTRKGWKNKVVDKRSMGLSSATLNQIRIGQSIKSIYFRASPETPSLSFQLKPFKMNKSDARFWIDVGEQKVLYKHGPKFWKDLSWSSEEGNNRVRVVFEDLDGGLHQKSFEGPWSWFHLQDQSAIYKTKKSNVFRVVFNAPDSNGGSPHKIEYLVQAKSVNNPFSSNLLGAFKCPSSI